MTKRQFIILFALITAVTAFAAATVQVIPPTRVVVGEKFAVTVRVINGSPDGAPARPNIGGCTCVFGPATSQMQSTQVINGRSSSTSRTDYTFTYRADRPGQTTIPAMTVRVDGRALTTRATNFTVSGSAADAQRAQQNKPTTIDDPMTQTTDRSIKTDDVFVRIILNKSTAYEQEAIECTIKLYTNHNIERFFPTKQPSFDGFLIEEVPIQNLHAQPEMLNGRRYVTAVLKKCIIFPQKSGKLTINSGEYDISVVQYDQVDMGLFSVPDARTRQIHVTSNTGTIDIKPLPAPQPDGFNGAVGNFTLDSRLIGNVLRTGEAASIVCTVSGSGNIKYVKEPALRFPSDFEVYTTKSDFDGGVNGATVTGTMTFDYTFVPRSVGEYTVPAEKFVYFDPESGQYKTLSTKSFTFNVEQGHNTIEDDADITLTDILPIKEGARSGIPSLAVYSLWYWLLWLIAIVGLIAAVGYARRQERLNADVKGRRLSRANKTAGRRLKAAKALLADGKQEQYYAELLSALWGYLRDKLMIPASQLTRDNVRQHLTTYGASDELIDKAIAILDEAEMARYAPTSEGSEQRLLTETEAVISDLEKSRKKA